MREYRRVEIFDETWASPEATRRYKLLLYSDAPYGNPDQKSRVGNDGLTGCLEEHGVEPSTMDALLRQLASSGRAETTI